MGIFRLGHKHVSPETLSEYLDGRLRSQARERLEGVISGCADCGRELEGLRDTAAMLRQLPVFTPRRSFVMAAPPVEAPRIALQTRPIFSFRVPQWTYAGAASLAALVLAVLVSLDASGLVAPALQDMVVLEHVDTTSITKESEAPIQERAGAKDEVQAEKPPQLAAAESIQVERKTAVEAPAAEMQAQAPAVAVMEAQAAPAAAESQAETTTEKSLKAPVAQLQVAEEPVVKSVQVERAGQPATPEPAPVQSEKVSGIQAEAVEILPLPAVASDGTAPESSQVQESPIAGNGPARLITPATPLAWRLLEGAAAMAFLVSAAVFFLRRRASRRF